MTQLLTVSVEERGGSKHIVTQYEKFVRISRPLDFSHLFTFLTYVSLFVCKAELPIRRISLTDGLCRLRVRFKMIN